MINVNCSSCGKKFTLDEKYIWKMGKCTCWVSFLIENSSESAKSEEQIITQWIQNNNSNDECFTLSWTYKESFSIWTNFYKKNISSILAVALSFSIATNILLLWFSDNIELNKNLYRLRGILWFYVVYTLINFVIRKVRNSKHKITESLSEANKNFGSTIMIWIFIFVYQILFYILIWILLFAIVWSYFTWNFALVWWLWLAIILVAWAMIYFANRYSFSLHNLVQFWDKWNAAINKSISQVKWRWFKVFWFKFLSLILPISLWIILSLYYSISWISDFALSIAYDILDSYLAIVFAFYYLSVTNTPIPKSFKE